MAGALVVYPEPVRGQNNKDIHQDAVRVAGAGSACPARPVLAYSGSFSSDVLL